MRRFITQRHSVSCRPVSTNTGLFGGFGMEKEGAELGSRGRPRDRLVGSLASIAPSWRLPPPPPRNTHSPLGRRFSRVLRHPATLRSRGQSSGGMGRGRGCPRGGGNTAAPGGRSQQERGHRSEQPGLSRFPVPEVPIVS